MVWAVAAALITAPDVASQQLDGVSNPVNLVANGNFEENDASGFPVGWGGSRDVYSRSTSSGQWGLRSFSVTLE